MSSLQPTMSSSSNPNFDENLWVINIRRTLEEELEDDIEMQVNVFNVPKILMATDPHSYIPQQVAIGPYHFWRSELQDMARYKLAAAKITEKNLNCLKFQDLVDQIKKKDLRIRACYHKYLDFSGETLAWMMAVDASFLLEFLQVYAVKDRDASPSRFTSNMSHLFDVSGRKSAHNSILRDIFMQENQIPLFVLRTVLETQLLSSDLADSKLFSMLMAFCKHVSPFKGTEKLPQARVRNGDHVLGFLYNTIVFKSGGEPEITEADEDQIHEADQDQIHEAKEVEVKESAETTFTKQTRVQQLFSDIWSLLSELNKSSVLSEPFQVVDNIFSHIPQFLRNSQDKDAVKPDNDNSNTDKPPLVEEIAVPSVTELSKAGVCFIPTNGGIEEISFDQKKCTFCLPTINIDINSEVILRNLVAYEACNASRHSVFARYTELMYGIIDTKEDAKLLRDRGIISNRLKSDQEVANLFNGINNTVRMTKVPKLDKVIEDVNKYYNGQWNVKVRKMWKVYVFESWQVLTLLATIVLLIMMSLQAFCSVYTCARIIPINHGQ